jgi:hypothetical protein
VANSDETARIKELINRSKDHIDVLGIVTPNAETDLSAEDILGHIGQLEELVRVYQAKEIIFSAQDVPFSVFTGTMSRLGPSLRYMLAASTTMNIVGSMGKDIAGESYAIQIHFNLSDQASRRAKRIFDLFSSGLLIIGFPLLLFIIPNPMAYFRNACLVFLGKRTWVSYYPLTSMLQSLPPLRVGILCPAYPTDKSEADRRLQHIHYVYARDYHWTTDLSIVITQFKKIGQTL